MREAIMQAFIYVVQAIIIVLGTYLVMFVRHKLELLKQRIGQERYLLLSEVAQNVVKAVEQVFGGKQGELKKSEAVRFLMQNFKLSEDEAEKLVEAAVFEMNKVLKSTQATWTTNTKQ